MAVYVPSTGSPLSFPAVIYAASMAAGLIPGSIVVIPAPVPYLLRPVPGILIRRAR